MLERIFGSSARVTIIKFFCTYTQGSYYLRELARTLELRVSALSRELDNLEQLGFLTSEEKDLKKFYSVNTEFPLLPELSALMLKSVVLLERAVVSDVLKFPGIQVFMLTGIFVNQDTGTDIVLVGTLNKKRVQSMITALSRSFHQPLRFTFLSGSEYRYRVDVSDKFIHKILTASPIVILNRYSKKT